MDPTEDDWDRSKTPFEAAQTDLNAIESADGFLVNMWRESVGSAIGMVQAFRAGRPVVVANPNWLNSHILAFYADAVTDDPVKAARIMRDILRAESRLTVLKSGGRGEEPFDREKLANAINSVCKSIGTSEIVIARDLLPDIIARLHRSGSQSKVKSSIPSSLIDAQVRETLSEAAKAKHGDFQKVLDRWSQFALEKKPHARMAVRVDRLREQPAEYGTTSVEVSCTKAHTSMWGVNVRTLRDIPSEEARKVVNLIAETAGVTRIILGPFGRKSRRAKVSAFVEHSKTPFVLEGGIYDEAPKGTIQKLHIWVQKEDGKHDVLEHITEALKGNGRWAKGR